MTAEGNPPALHEAIRRAFERAGEDAFAGCQMVSSVEDGHGRHEERDVTVLKNPRGLPEAWAGVGAVVMLGRERCAAGKNARSARYYLTGLKCGAKKLASYIRGPWGIEIPQPDDRRSDNLCDTRRAEYHLGRCPVGVGRVVRPARGPRRLLMPDTDLVVAPPRR